MVAEGQRKETFQYLCQYYPSKKRGGGFRIILNILFNYFKINLINLLLFMYLFKNIYLAAAGLSCWLMGASIFIAAHEISRCCL